MKKKLALIGCGALGHIIAEQISKLLADEYTLVAILGNPTKQTAAFAAKYNCQNCADIKEILGHTPDYVIEAASTGAIASYANAILQTGTNMIVLSIGALANDTLADTLKNTAAASGAKLYLASGAIGGFDLMRTLSLMDTPKVRVDNYKAPDSLAGAPYLNEKQLSTQHRELIFDGNARQAIAGFPKNVNVAVAAAVATVGVDDTIVTIESNPDLKENVHRIQMQTDTTTATVEIASRPDPNNPRSSSLAAWSVIALLKELSSPVQFF